MEIKQEKNGTIYGENKYGIQIYKFQDGYISIRHKKWEDSVPCLLIHVDEIGEELPSNEY